MIRATNTRSVRYTYRDYAPQPDSKTMSSPETSKSDKAGKECEANASDRFPSKLGEILSSNEFWHIIAWQDHGRSFKIYDKTALEQVVLPRFFKSANYSSFVRLLNAWQFRRIKGRSHDDGGEGDFNSYYHELFLRGCPLLLNRMRRLQRNNDRKAPIDIKDEPDFSKLAPLPEDPQTSGVNVHHTEHVSSSEISFSGNQKQGGRSESCAQEESGVNKRSCRGVTPTRTLVTAPPDFRAGADLVELRRMLLLQRLLNSQNDAFSSVLQPAVSTADLHGYGMPWSSRDARYAAHSKLLGMPAHMASASALQAARYAPGVLPGFLQSDVLYPGIGAAAFGHPDILYANRSCVPTYFPRSAAGSGVGISRDAAMKGLLASQFDASRMGPFCPEVTKASSTTCLYTMPKFIECARHCS
jgi:hypothetical protein